ncbi:MAG: endonuclease/exonuclease/phosphatase family protein [Epsilonproteobacteria bacterium]|nr:endonuclease/exonuclease/phosphatase family protein [Campylobacterota bacterium]
MYKRFLIKVEKRNSLLLKSVTKKSLYHRDIGVLVWNVYKQNDKPHWQNEFKKIMFLHHPDIIMLQESVANFHIDPIGYHYYGYLFFPNFSYKHRYFGLLNASRSKIVDFKSYFSKHREPILKTPKMILATKYLLNNFQILLVVNVHLINFVRTDKFAYQLKQIEEVCKNHKGPMIVAGDFNTWNKKRVDLLAQITTDLGLKKVNFPTDGEKKSLLKQPLDYIFYKELQLKDKRVLEFCQSSDHKPLIATFTV